jgi:hypothetical protein
LGDAKLSAKLKVADGRTFDLSSVCQSWSRCVVTDDEETAACLSAACGGVEALSVGSEISQITVRSSVPLRVLGVYWESTDAFDDN